MTTSWRALISFRCEQQARGHLERAARIHEDYLKVYVLRAVLLNQAGDFEGSLRVLERMKQGTSVINADVLSAMLIAVSRGFADPDWAEATAEFALGQFYAPLAGVWRAAGGTLLAMWRARRALPAKPRAPLTPQEVEAEREAEEMRSRLRAELVGSDDEGKGSKKKGKARGNKGHNDPQELFKCGCPAAGERSLFFLCGHFGCNSFLVD
jgi:hypothetical protein